MLSLLSVEHRDDDFVEIPLRCMYLSLDVIFRYFFLHTGRGAFCTADDRRGNEVVELLDQ